MSENKITLTDVRKARSFGDGEALVKAAVLAVHDADVAGETATVAASFATYAAIRTGYLRDGTRSGEGIGTGDYADMFGKTASTVSLWKALGKALVDVKVSPTKDRALWNVLANKSKAATKDVGEAIRAEGATVATVQAACEKVWDFTTGKAIPQTKGPDTGAAEETPADVAARKAAEKELKRIDALQNATPAAKALGAAKMLDDALKSGEMSEADTIRVVKVLAKIVERENTLQAKRDAEAAESQQVA